MRRPYNGEYSVNVIRHDNPLVQRHVRKMLRNRTPTRVGDPAGVVWQHSAIDHVTEQHRAFMRANRNEVRTVGRVVEAGKPKRMSASWAKSGRMIHIMRPAVAFMDHARCGAALRDPQR